ncbi:unnamed protein product [Trichobilharzia regenti]|nr:unnamed protein product [Trichobilharzia regenti]
MQGDVRKFDEKDATNDHRVLLFTTPSELTRLSTQCLHTIRTKVIQKILDGLSGEEQQQQHNTVALYNNGNNCNNNISDDIYSTLFHNSISQIHLPYPVKKLILRNFIN